MDGACCCKGFLCSLPAAGCTGSSRPQPLSRSFSCEPVAARHWGVGPPLHPTPPSTPPPIAYPAPWALNDSCQFPEFLPLAASIPSPSCPRPRPRTARFVKRVRAAKIHILLIGHLRKQMPTMFGTAKAQKKLMDDIVTHFEAVGGHE